MSHSQAVWQEWIKKFQAWGIANLCATLMEGLSPIALLGAQFLYFGQPVIHLLMANRKLDELIRLLEDPEAYQTFTHELRREALV